MRIIMIGCEYVGKTTLAAQVSEWLERNMGLEQHGRYRWHDHFELPFHEGEGEAAEKNAEHVLAMPPTLLEQYARYMIHYHLGKSFYLDNHHLLVNWYYSDAVYAPLYYGYGGRDEYADRQAQARYYDSAVMAVAPDTVLVLLKASAEVVRRRMSEQRHPRCILEEKDVELVLRRFEEEYTRSGIRRRFVLDTTTASVEETFHEFLQKIEPHITEQDHLAMLSHERMMNGQSSRSAA